VRGFDSESGRRVGRAPRRTQSGSKPRTGGRRHLPVVIARERTARHPLRTYLWVPFQRVLTIWFTPRIELLPYSGNVFPLKQKLGRRPPGSSRHRKLFLSECFLSGLACAGAWKLWNGKYPHSPALLAIAVYLVLRTLFPHNRRSSRTSLRSSLFPCDSSVGSRRVHPPAQIGSYSSLVSRSQTSSFFRRSGVNSSHEKSAEIFP